MKNSMKKTALLTVLILALAVPASAAETGYADVPENAWYASAAAYCRDHGLMSGTAEGQFSPDRPMTRGMLAAVLYRLAGSPAVGGEGSPFPDVETGSWCGPAVTWAGEKGVLNGYASGNFGPNDPITREQMAAAFWRFSGSPAATAEDFADESAVSAYAGPAVDWARSTGLMNGRADGRFAPKDGASRAHMAQVLANYAGAPRTASQVSAMDIMCQPCGIAAMEDGSLLVTDGYNKIIWRVADGKSAPYAGADSVEDVYGQPVGGYHDSTRSESLFKDPWAIAPFLGGWAVSDAENGVVRFLRPEEDTKSNRTDVTDLGIQFDYPTGLAADSEGNLYVSETHGGRVRKITPKGEVTTLASGLAEPMGLCWVDGIVYVAESGGNRILRIDKNRRVTVVAGSGSGGSADGSVEQAAFSSPKGVAVDRDGTVYVADTDNGKVRRIRDGQVTTILSRDPRNVTALFPAAPTGLLIQGDTLYISDTFARKLLALPLR